MSYDQNFKNLILDYPHQARRGLLSLESDPERQAKYLDFSDVYTALDDNERGVLQACYPDEVEAMSSFAERFTERGLKQGLQQGEAAVLIRQMERKFGALTEAQRRRIETADVETLLTWSERILVVQSPEEVLR
ncbi:DUF4351 domain-containing protein [Nitrococcus mobilis]|uniref:Putative transposase n=1 Tax=Nitrococcus mobilis Nb-231 TaxID=314278 RepID=A4BMC0_9GAMM|nr:DUF4351 domain-containing protein [Nitrococcus mobilis]EAR23458.1 putative transposase [Nitrococcus mobilis Nb-231]